MVVLLLFVAVGLYFHFRWALLNTRNHAGTPGLVSTALRAVFIAVLILTAPALTANQEGIAGPMVWMFAIGFAFGPSLTPPRATDLGGSYTIWELFYDRVIGQGVWALVKGGVVWLLAMLVGLIPGDTIVRPEFWTMFFLALILGSMKLSFVMGVVGAASEVRRKLGYADDVTLTQMQWTGAMGFVGLLAWVWVCHLFLLGIPKVDMTEWYGPVALFLGMWLSGVLER